MEIMIFCTTANRAEAEAISALLLERKLIACSNVLDGVHSLFWWEGSVQNEKEHIMIMKTTEDLFEQVEETVRKMHSYDVPEIIALPIVKGSKDYLNWLREAVKQ